MSGSLPAGDGQRPVEHNAERGRRVQLMPSPPDSECSSSDDEDEEAAGPDHMELAGFEYCAREAIRYLVEEERLDAGHPMVRQLRQRLFADAQDAMDHPPDASGPRPSDDAAPRQ